MSKKTIVLAAGGTGGHIFPAEALADELIAKGYRVVMIVDARYKTHAYTPEKLEVRQIYSASTSGGLLSKIRALLSISIGFWQAIKILKKENPDVVIGFGGYPSFPTMLAAIRLKKRTIIHEQNSVLGRVNRFLSPFVGHIATSFMDVRGVGASDVAKIVLTGNPVRAAIKAVKDMPYPVLKDGEGLHLLIFGGSQGATVFSEIVPEAIIRLPESIRKRIRIDQQCRQEDVENVRAVYDAAGINCDLATFFEDMPSRIAAAHIVIARAGASTISELAVAGKPSILVPYMHAMDDHQTYNAIAMKKCGAAIVLAQKTLSADILGDAIKGLIENPESLTEMAVNALDMGRGCAVDKLADLVVG